LELKHVRIFVMAAEHLSFSKVAELTYTSQSSVSKYISILEDELNDTLFIRDGRGVILSDFGAAFLPYAKDLLAKEAESLKFLKNFRKGQKYSLLRIGIDTMLTVSPPDIFFLNLIKAANSFHADFPHVNFDIKYYGCAELYTFLNSNRLDLIITVLSNHQAEERAGQNNNYVCLNSSNNYLAASPNMDVSGGLEAVLPRINTLLYASNDHMPQSVTYSFMNEYGVSAGVQVCDHWTDLFFKIIFEDGVAILPDNMRDIVQACGMRIIELGDFSVKSGLYAMWNKDNYNENIQQFVSAMKKASE
jgi:DNA-binding transcriptional LysR family regulator